jgi:hypothetical protein
MNPALIFASIMVGVTIAMIIVSNHGSDDTTPNAPAPEEKEDK